ncbi:hypothetical protein [Mangrovimonas spongiae]|uniref:DUF4309 domain-containing protein n=1 Tax=Mangrovimonas spongiae TaxID=2494697 RepID=A0A3R9MJD0_9FLAO|nr:hypothetical protein [Mangrovimonas spongiae]RSK41775.1 hypothetical protein EJA19_02530 [Mangrovimonas spongiae]
MKKSNFIIPMLFFFAISCKAQNNSISKNQATINDHIVFKASSNFLIENFGQPESIESYFFETEDSSGEIYHYLGASFYLLDDKIDSFEIDSNLYNFTSNSISVGDSIDSIQNIYPFSYSNRENGEIIITFTDADYFISIHYDANDFIHKINLNVY